MPGHQHCSLHVQFVVFYICKLGNDGCLKSIRPSHLPHPQLVPLTSYYFLKCLILTRSQGLISGDYMGFLLFGAFTHYRDIDIIVPKNYEYISESYTLSLQ